MAWTNAQINCGYRLVALLNTGDLVYVYDGYILLGHLTDRYIGVGIMHHAEKV